MQMEPTYVAPPYRKCACCGVEIPDDENMFEITTNYFVCEDCFWEDVRTNYSAESVAEQLGVPFEKRADI